MKSLSRQTLKNSYSMTLLRTLVTLSIPTIVEEVLATLLQYVDTAMVGQLGEQATASVSITTTVTWLFNSIPGAIGTAVLILISKADGAGDREQVKKLSSRLFFFPSSLECCWGRRRWESAPLSPPGWGRSPPFSSRHPSIT